MNIKRVEDHGVWRGHRTWQCQREQYRNDRMTELWIDNGREALTGYVTERGINLSVVDYSFHEAGSQITLSVEQARELCEWLIARGTTE